MNKIYFSEHLNVVRGRDSVLIYCLLAQIAKSDQFFKDLSIIFQLNGNETRAVNL